MKNGTYKVVYSLPKFPEMTIVFNEIEAESREKAREFADGKILEFKRMYGKAVLIEFKHIHMNYVEDDLYEHGKDKFG